MNELLNNCDFWKEDARMAYRLPLLVICADITNWSRHVSHHVQTWLQSSQPSTSGRTTTWLELSCEVKPFAIVDVDHKEKLSFSSLFAGFLFVTLWKCLRINSLGFVFLVASLNGSVLFMPLWKVGHFRSSTGEFGRIAEASLHLMFWAFYSTPDIDGRQLLEQMENCIFQERVNGLHHVRIQSFRGRRFSLMAGRHQGTPNALVNVLGFFLLVSWAKATNVGGSPAEVGDGHGPLWGQGHWQQKLWEAVPGVRPPRVHH